MSRSPPEKEDLKILPRKQGSVSVGDNIIVTVNALVYFAKDKVF